MAHLNESNLVLVRPERLHNAVNSVARKPENNLHAPVQQGLD